MEWQPIETAPKDGKWFVTARFKGDDPEYEVGCYDPTKFHQYDERPDGLFERREIEIYEWRGFNNFSRATHWAPLPPPPETP